MTRTFVKRMLDIVVSVFCLVVFAPVLLVLIFLVALLLGRPVFFTQTRPGLQGKPFRIVKFRTMKSTVNKHGKLLPDAERMTKFGSVLRSSSLDELPELWNVLRGDMSLVGPRPLLMQYLPLYSRRQARRHEVRPGITGWAQVNGRNALTWPEKFELDVWYVDNHNLRLDLRILAKTVARVISRADINRDGHATMPPFTGEQSGVPPH